MSNFYGSSPYGMLMTGRVGQMPPGIMVPGPVSPPAPPFMSMPPAVYGPNCGTPFGYPGGCFPNNYCPPQDDQFYGSAIRSAAASHMPQSALPISSRPGDPLEPDESRVLKTEPSVPICLTQLIVSRTSVSYFGISSISAARVEYLSDGGAIPADMFAPDSLVRPTQLPQLYPGTSIKVTIINFDTAAHHFDASFVGISKPGCTPCI